MGYHQRHTRTAVQTWWMRLISCLERQVPKMMGPNDTAVRFQDLSYRLSTLLISAAACPSGEPKRQRRHPDRGRPFASKKQHNPDLRSSFCSPTKGSTDVLCLHV